HLILLVLLFVFVQVAHRTDRPSRVRVVLPSVNPFHKRVLLCLISDCCLRFRPAARCCKCCVLFWCLFSRCRFGVCLLVFACRSGFYFSGSRHHFIHNWFPFRIFTLFHAKFGHNKTTLSGGSVIYLPLVLRSPPVLTVGFFPPLPWLTGALTYMLPVFLI